MTMISRAPIPIESLAVTRPKDRERLLIIDTSVLLADSIASAVLAAGYGEARVAHCPNLALRLMGQRAPTMVLADLGLATDNEFELLQALAAEFSQARVIVMMDGEDDPTAGGGCAAVRRGRAGLPQSGRVCILTRRGCNDGCWNGCRRDRSAVLFLSSRPQCRDLGPPKLRL